MLEPILVNTVSKNTVSLEKSNSPVLGEVSKGSLSHDNNDKNNQAPEKEEHGWDLF